MTYFSTKNRFTHYFWPLLAYLLPIVPAFAYYWDYLGTALSVYALATIFGVFAYCYFLNALIFATRIRYFDRLYGHDRVMRFHGVMAFTSFLLASTHRFLKIQVAHLPFHFSLFAGQFAYFLFAGILLITLLFMIKSLFHRLAFLNRLRLKINAFLLGDYSILKNIHNLLVLAALMATFHVLQSSNTQGYFLRTIFMGAYALLAFVLYIRFKFLRPRQRAKKEYKISALHLLGDGITEIHLTGPPLKYKAGQFAYWIFPSLPLNCEEHPFTISSAPEEASLSLSAKALGDYTRALPELKLGDRAHIDGPYGQFILPPDKNCPLVFLAGGIGITPFYAMIKNLVAQKSTRPLSLLWGVRNHDALVYDHEFRKLGALWSHFRYLPVIQDNPREKGPREWELGYITEALILQHCPYLLESKNTLVYLCGPDPMREAIMVILRRLRFPKNRIKVEQFSFS